MISAEILELIKTIFVACGIEAESVKDAHETDILKDTPRVTMSCGDDSLTQDVDLVGVVRNSDTETRYYQRYVRTIPVDIEIVHDTTADAEALALSFLAQLPTRTAVNNIRIGIKAEKVTRKQYSGDQLVGIRDAKAVIAMKITEPVIRAETLSLIKTIEITNIKVTEA